LLICRKSQLIHTSTAGNELFKVAILYPKKDIHNMTNSEIAGMYERDISKLIEEINSFKDDGNLWKTCGTIKNSSGNLALHIIGGLNYLIGATLSNTGYIRNRDQEFTDKGIGKKRIVQQLQELIPMINETLHSLTPEQMDSPYPAFFDKENATNSYVLTQLLLHLNYHLGQVNYLRRVFE
jgi:Protein of unknown function (DUF1572)